MHLKVKKDSEADNREIAREYYEFIEEKRSRNRNRNKLIRVQKKWLSQAAISTPATCKMLTHLQSQGRKRHFLCKQDCKSRSHVMKRIPPFHTVWLLGSWLLILKFKQRKLKDK